MPAPKLSLWAAAAAAAGALSWAAYRGPPPRPAAPSPTPLPRPATAAEWSAVQAQAQEMTHAIEAGRARTGALPTAAELEGRDATGALWLPGGIPDNPLAPGVGTIGTSCASSRSADRPPDWWYCPDSGEIRPGGAQSGNE